MKKEAQKKHSEMFVSLLVSSLIDVVSRYAHAISLWRLVGTAFL